MYTEDEYLLLSGIQHFSFCRRQWALIHIEQAWSENALTAESRLNHERVHNADEKDIRNGILTIRGMQIKSASLGVTGQCDAVEFIPSEEGALLSGRNGLWRVHPVEYKHGSTKINDCDRLQAAAQAMCLEEMFCLTIPEASVFYHETRKRETIAITDDVRTEVREIVKEMHELFSKRHTPHAKKSPSCKSCSLADICLPKLSKGEGYVSVKSYVDELLKKEKI